MTLAPRGLPVRAEPQAWFDRRTHHADDFDAALLARRKAALDLRVSVVLPARDEVATVAGVVRAVDPLRPALVDEVIVVDDGSTDGTARTAAGAGATVVPAERLMPGYGPTLGKADVLWRSLAVATGDIVVFLDADVANPDPRFVVGLLGPLLVGPEVHLVKAFYDRPVRVDGVLHRTGGGRVTELLARPLLNALWPELAGLVQPLSGEYAGRRSLLTAVPFLTGYGVELALLVDTLRTLGVDAIAQVDVGRRVHRNQSVEALSRMAFAIARVALERSGTHGGTVDPLLHDAYTQFARGADERVCVQTSLVPVAERPPAAGLVADLAAAAPAAER